jgi:hypothetical protein
MVTIGDVPAMNTFEEFARQVEALANVADHASSTTPWFGRRAATLAYQAGACDQLITAALVHDLPEDLVSTKGYEERRSSADTLASLFPEQVIGLLRPLPGLGSSVVTKDSSGSASPGVTAAHRLRRFVHAAHAQPHGPVMPISSLLRIARRMSLDDR